MNLQFVVKILLLSIGISVGIKLLGISLQLSSNPVLALLMVFTPPLVLGLILLRESQA